MKLAQWLVTTARVSATPSQTIELEIASPSGTDDTDKSSFKAEQAFFSATARKLLFAGYLEVKYTLGAGDIDEDNGDDTGQEDAGEVLSRVKARDKLELEALTPKQHFTKPPPRYTEASLVRALEKFDIGRPSTYAPIISTIEERGYVRKLQRKLHASDLGILITDKLEEFFADIMNTDFTAQMEDKLDEVEEGKTEWLVLLKEFYTF